MSNWTGRKHEFLNYIKSLDSSDQYVLKFWNDMSSQIHSLPPPDISDKQVTGCFLFTWFIMPGYLDISVQSDNSVHWRLFSDEYYKDGNSIHNSIADLVSLFDIVMVTNIMNT